MSVYVVYKQTRHYVARIEAEHFPIPFEGPPGSREVFSWSIVLTTTNHEEAITKAASLWPVGVIVEQPERRARTYRIRGRTPLG